MFGSPGLPLVAPIAKLRREYRNEVSKQSNKKAWLLSGLAAGGFPTQAVLYEDRRVVDLRCQVCFGEPGAQMH
eukprot:7223017-Pyramimonas_sp.AAC.1